MTRGLNCSYLSPNMLPKQREMDGIVEHIYNSMERESHLKSSLLVLLGDERCWQPRRFGSWGDVYGDGLHIT